MGKRRLIQILSAAACNGAVPNLFSGTVSASPLKRICVPGLNCHSCPAAVASCPAGSLQTFLAGGRFPFFTAGFLLLAGVLGGRAVCGFLCPFGFFQEILHKIAGKRKTRAARRMRPAVPLHRLSSAARPVKYAVLLLFVLALPLAMYIKNGYASPYFCAYICPAGTLGAGIPLVLADEALRAAVGFLFSWKVSLAVFFVLWSFFTFRPFCKYVCPLGALYGLFNRIAWFGIQVDAEKCTGCGRCTAGCKMNAAAVNGLECIRCGECLSLCPEQALFVRGFCPARSLRTKHT